MHIIRSIICLIILSFGIQAKAAEIVGIEAKEYDNVDAFVFYHTNYLKLNVSYINGIVTITSEHPIHFRKLTPVYITSLTTGLKNINDKTITFSTKDSYENYEIINGEKLTALKFRTTKKFDKIDHKIQVLNKLDNPTSGMHHESQGPESKDVVPTKTKNGYELKFEFDEKVAAGGFQRGKRRQQNDRICGIETAHFAHQIQPRHARHIHIGEHNARPTFARHAQGLGGIR